ncbi:MAG: serine/threonine protein kinase [Candidatus Bathyarchaeia archaeon]|nr:serine/threonine protein kinase [Candidatus Bathyarchaeota archaeon]
MAYIAREMAHKMELIIPIEELLLNAKYGQIICYPRYDPAILKKRIEEMRRIGIKAVIFSGGKSISGVPVLGKGCVGIVIAAILEDNNKVALKILRTDVEAGRLLHEVEMLRIANSVNVGPKLLGFSECLLTMEYIDGELLPKWVKRLSGDKESVLKRLRRVLRDILEQCWRLDSIGLDHGELSWADKHIIIDPEEKPHILDFETASNRRMVSNVTSVTQYLFIRGRTASLITQKFGSIDKNILIQILRAYKTKRTRDQFESILETIGLLTQK